MIGENPGAYRRTAPLPVANRDCGPDRQFHMTLSSRDFMNGNCASGFHRGPPGPCHCPVARVRARCGIFCGPPVMNNKKIFTSVAILLGLLPLSAAVAADFKVVLDARDIRSKRVHTQLTIPVTAGPLTLVFPKWLPG